MMGILNEVLYILVAQEAAKLSEVKFGGTKKIWDSNPGHTQVMHIRLNGRFFSGLQL